MHRKQKIAAILAACAVFGSVLPGALPKAEAAADYAYIQRLYPDPRFNLANDPNRIMTVEEFVAVVSAYSFTSGGVTPVTAADQNGNPPSAWCAPYVQAEISRGLLDPSSVSWSQPATVAFAAKLLSRAKGKSSIDSANLYSFTGTEQLSADDILYLSVAVDHGLLSYTADMDVSRPILRRDALQYLVPDGIAACRTAIPGSGNTMREIHVRLADCGQNTEAAETELIRLQQQSEFVTMVTIPYGQLPAPGKAEEEEEEPEPSEEAEEPAEEPAEPNEESEEPQEEAPEPNGESEEPQEETPEPNGESEEPQEEAPEPNEESEEPQEEPESPAEEAASAAEIRLRTLDWCHTAGMLTFLEFTNLYDGERSDETLSLLMQDIPIQEEMIRLLVEAAAESGADGIALDLRMAPESAYLRDAYSGFLLRLSDALHAKELLLTVSCPSCCTDEQSESGFCDYALLRSAADYICLYTDPQYDNGTAYRAGACMRYAAVGLGAEKLLLELDPGESGLSDRIAAARQYDFCGYSIGTLIESASESLSELASGAAYHSEVTEAMAAHLVPDSLRSQYDKPITRLEFCRMTDALVTAVSPETFAHPMLADDFIVFPDCNDPVIRRAVELGVVQGFPDGTFRPDDSITRQQAAVMLTRLAAGLGFTEPNNEPLVFEESPTLPEWAAGGVSFISACADPVSGRRVMSGTGSGRFSPVSGCTREQAMMMMLRLYHILTAK